MVFELLEASISFFISLINNIFGIEFIRSFNEFTFGEYDNYEAAFGFKE